MRKYFIIILYLPLLTLFFYSCSKDDGSINYDLRKYKNIASSEIKYEIDFVKRIENVTNVKRIAKGDGSLWVLASNVVVKTDLKLNEEKRFAVFKEAYDLAYSRGRIYLAYKNRVGIYNEEGDSIALWPIADENSRFVSLSLSSDSVYVSDFVKKCVWRYNQKGRLIKIISYSEEEDSFVLPSLYFDLYVKGEGPLFAVNSGKRLVYEIDSKGDITKRFGESGLHYDKFSGCCNPAYMSVTKEGAFIFSEKGSLLRVKVHDSEGKYESIVAVKKDFPKREYALDVAAFDLETVYVLSETANSVYVYKRTSK